MSTTAPQPQSPPAAPSVDAGTGPERSERGSQASPSRTGQAQRTRRQQLLVWLTGPMLLLTGVAGVVLVTQGDASLFGWTIGGLFSMGLGWVLISSLFPAEPDRQCPECHKPTLVRLDPLTTRGIRCVACDFEDPDASSFLMAEQEGPLENTVLHERSSGRGPLRRTIPRRKPRLADRPQQD